MVKRIAFRGIDHSNEIEKYANQQLARIEHFLVDEEKQSPVYLDLIFEPSKLHAFHFVELRVKSPLYEKISSYEGTDFYDTLDRVCDVMYQELHEEKRRIKHDDPKTVGRHDEFKKQR